MVVLFGLTLYSGAIPPMMVAQSGSMMHGDDNQLNTIDTGDLIVYEKVHWGGVHGQVTAWVEKVSRHYGAFGDVIIFEKNGEGGTPILHRAVAWMEVNWSRNTPSYDIPDLGIYNVTDEVVVEDYPAFGVNGKETMDLVIDISLILDVFKFENKEPFSGYITKGDHNSVADQNHLVDYPVAASWVLGKARGEVPWYGLPKLLWDGELSEDNPAPGNSWGMFFVSLLVVFTGILTIDISANILCLSARKRKKA
jgi:signal peptidase